MKSAGSAPAAYAAATLIGAAAAYAMLPLATLDGSGGLWTNAVGDSSVALTGHLAFQAPGWHWPPLLATNLFWPQGRSILLTDSNPAISLLAKAVAMLSGKPVNLLGLWLAACWLLQPIAAIYALRGLAHLKPAQSPPSLEASVAAACFSLLCPAWLYRHHVNLLGHFLLLAALGLAARLHARPSRAGWRQAGALLTLCMLVHPYLFLFAAAVLSAPALRAASAGPPPSRWRALVAYAAVYAVPLLLIRVLGGRFDANAGGYTHYSMNLLSPVWPQLSGLFGAQLPILDATGGQYEGFNYLGGGVLLLAGAATFRLLLRSRNIFSAGLGWLIAPLAALTLLAITPRIYAGHHLLLPLPAQPWRGLFGAVQSSGRAFWLVGYAISLASILTLDRQFKRRLRMALFATALALQIADTAPLRATDAAFLAGRHNAAPPFPIPPGVVLLRVQPVCDPANAPADQFRLAAARIGARLGEVRVARNPPGFDCATSLSDALETPLTPGEMRIFLPSAQAIVRPDALGETTSCLRNVAATICANQIALPRGGALLPTPPLATPAANLRLTGKDLAPLLATAWHVDETGAWSLGARATLLFRVPASVGRMTMTLAATDEIELRMNDSAPILANSRTVTLALPASVADRALRIVFDMPRPGQRRKGAPSIRLSSLEFLP